MKTLARIMITLAAIGASTLAAAGTIEMKVNGLVCGFCAQGIEKTLRKKAATADVLVNLEHKLVAVQTKEGTDLTDAEVTKALTDAGYDVKSIDRTARPLSEIRASLKTAKGH
jgi:copper chaperone CopZ